MPRPPGDLPNAPTGGATQDRTRPRAPDGTYRLTIGGIKDRGWQEDRFGGPDRPELRVTVNGDLQTGESFTLVRDITHSYDPRSILSLLGAAIFGIDPNDEDAELDWRKLVRGRFLGTLKSRSYHPKDDEGKSQEDVTHFFTEWKGDPQALPVGDQPEIVGTDSWEAVYTPLRTLLVRVLKKYGWEAGVDNAESLAALWAYGKQVPQVARLRAEYGGFIELTPETLTTEQIAELAPLIERWLAGEDIRPADEPDDLPF